MNNFTSLNFQINQASYKRWSNTTVHRVSEQSCESSQLHCWPEKRFKSIKLRTMAQHHCTSRVNRITWASSNHWRTKITPWIAAQPNKWINHVFKNVPHSKLLAKETTWTSSCSPSTTVCRPRALQMFPTACNCHGLKCSTTRTNFICWRWPNKTVTSITQVIPHFFPSFRKQFN